MIIALKSKVAIPDNAKLKKQFAYEMGRYVAEVHKVMATYPPQAAEAAPVYERRRVRSEKTGRMTTRRVLVSGYKRTGTLGRGWHHKVEVQATRIVGTVANATPYGVWVEGPAEEKGIFGTGVGKGAGQSRLMGQRGWPAIDKVARERWKASQKILQALITAECKKK